MRTIIALLFVLFAPICMFAKCTKEINAMCSTKNGWTEYLKATATFETGSELNRTGNTDKYDMEATYAVIVGGEGRANIIKLADRIICGPEMDCSCLTNLDSELEGIDQQGISWKICTADDCK